MTRRSVLRITSGTIAAGVTLIGENGGYPAEIADWRRKHELDVRSDKGPLLLIGRYDLTEGKNVIGSDASNSIALPQHAPKIVGTLERRGSVVTFAPAAGIDVTLNGKRMSGPAVLKVGA